MRTHVRLLVDDIGDENNGVRDFRKHVSWYLTGYPVGGEVRREMALTVLARRAGRAARRDSTRRCMPHPDAARAKRGHTNGPRPVALPYGWLDNAESVAVPEGGELLVSGG